MVQYLEWLAVNLNAGKDCRAQYTLPPPHQKEERKQVKYRKLKPDEIICKGDEWSSDGHKWIETAMAGESVAQFGLPYRRPLKKKKGSK